MEGGGRERQRSGPEVRWYGGGGEVEGQGMGLR